MGGRSGPLSPQSIQGSEWSGVSQYQYSHHSGQVPSSPTIPHNRGDLATPPVSGSSNGTQPRMSNGINSKGGPSPPNSIARSSYGTTLSSSDTQRRKTLQMEERLSQHYTVLKRFLAQSLRDEKGNPKPNRARDKLLRLSPVQFQELSTDVYDELLRRQSSSGQHRNGPNQVPEYLLPRDNFHPKRNQARQKLATLPPPRFQDLATDVFYELERRFPMFAGRDINRVGSPVTSQYGGPPSRVGTPNGTRHHYGSRNASLGSQVMAGLGIPGVEGQDGYGKPTAKTSQSNTIIPNKSTMVEDDDDENSDVYGSRRDTTFTSRSIGASDPDRKHAENQVREFEHRVDELQGKVKELEDQLRDKDAELDKVYGSHNHQQAAHDTERESWSNLQSDLEGKLTQVRELNTDLQAELEKARDVHSRIEQDLRAQLASRSDGGEWEGRFASLSKEHEGLRSQLSQQQRVTSEVRQEAAGWLSQMREISEQGNISQEREERLIRQVHTIEKELQDWKSRYAKTRTQLGALHSPSMTDPLQSADTRGLVKDFTTDDGLIKNMHITRFQVAIDGLLQSARGNEPGAVLTQVKDVIIAIRSITLDLGSTTSGKDAETHQKHKLKVRASATANNLITAAKNFAASRGLSPLSLLDAAASHIVAVVIELIHLVKIRPSRADELEDEGENSIIADSPSGYYGIPISSAGASVSSTDGFTNPPRPSHPSVKTKGTSNGMVNGAGHPPALKPLHQVNPLKKVRKIEELKGFLESRTDSLLPTIQNLISSIRVNAEPPDVLDYLASITSTTSQIINKTSEDADTDDQKLSDILQTLAETVDKLEDAGREGEEIGNEKDWNAFVKGLPPLAFTIARNTKELGVWIADLEQEEGFS